MFSRHQSPSPCPHLITPTRIPSPMPDYQRPSGRKDFEVAFICALEREYDAVCLTFDHSWSEQYGRAPEDSNQYTTGRIDKYNVVVVLLESMGPTNSASATASLRISFPGV